MKIKNFNELEFAVFCIENVAQKLGVNAKQVYQAFAEKVTFSTDISFQNMTYYTPRVENIS